MASQANINLSSIMSGFAAATGLTADVRPPRRYLWTDAFAVCNYIELYRQTADQQHLQLAIRLVDQVHRVLGRKRDGSTWLSGLDDEQAAEHPTQGGLRIGKQLDERRADEAVDEHLEWDRDGQYFHYLTKWMHALNCLCRATGNRIYNQWAIELAQVAFRAFTYTPVAGGVTRMYWKMSIDLSRPLLYSMGQHDPLDGLLTYQSLAATARLFPGTPGKPNLQQEIAGFTVMCAGIDWATRDALGIGGLLMDACRLAQLTGVHSMPDYIGLESLLRAIDRSLRTFVSADQHNPINLPAEYRLAFRELGLAIGLAAIDKIQLIINGHRDIFRNHSQLIAALEELSRYAPLYSLIKDFWSKAGHRANDTWQEHKDINNVMLATCLAPDSFLEI